MKYYVFELIPPRPTFPADITPAEAKLMQEHVRYWRGLMDKGLVAVFGPVADPKGTYGIAVLQLPDDADAHSLGENDPTIRANAGFGFEVHPMPDAVLPATSAG